MSKIQDEKEHTTINSIDEWLKPGDKVQVTRKGNETTIIKLDTGESITTYFDYDEFERKLESMRQTLSEAGIELDGLPLDEAYDLYDQIIAEKAKK